MVRRGQPEQEAAEHSIRALLTSELYSNEPERYAGRGGWLGSALLLLQSGDHGHDLNTGEQRKAQKGFMSNGVRIVLLKGRSWKKVGRECGARRTDQRGDSIRQETREAAWSGLGATETGRVDAFKLDSGGGARGLLMDQT